MESNQIANTPKATRTDIATREVAQFLGPTTSSIFAYTHMPVASSVQGCVVICSPLFAEFIRNYRREVLLARRLASDGIAVARFHYQGQGNSQGESDETTFETMRDDALMIADHLLESTGPLPIAFLGTRFGGLVAAAAASRYVAAPLVLWDPVNSASQYLKDIHRAQRLQVLKISSAGSDEPGELLEERLRSGDAQVLGYTLTPALFASATDRDLGSQLGPRPRPTLVVSLGSNIRLDGRLQRLIGSWREWKWPVEVHAVGQREPWWFSAGEAIQAERQDQALEMTMTWLTRSLVESRGDS